MSSFDIAQKFTAEWEGGLSDDAADRGGLTHWGVSMAFLSDLEYSSRGAHLLRSLGVSPLPVTRKTIKALTQKQAEAIFKSEFWDKLGLDTLPVQMAVLLYDAAVNTGCGQSVRLAQRGYNVAGVGTSIEVDGKLGPITRKALTEHNIKEVRQGILDVREIFYRDLVIKNLSQSVFFRGWLNRTDALRKYVESI